MACSRNTNEVMLAVSPAQPSSVSDTAVLSCITSRPPFAICHGTKSENPSSVCHSGNCRLCGGLAEQGRSAIHLQPVLQYHCHRCNLVVGLCSLDTWQEGCDRCGSRSCWWHECQADASLKCPDLTAVDTLPLPVAKAVSVAKADCTGCKICNAYLHRFL